MNPVQGASSSDPRTDFLMQEIAKLRQENELYKSLLQGNSSTQSQKGGKKKQKKEKVPRASNPTPQPTPAPPSRPTLGFAPSQPSTSSIDATIASVVDLTSTQAAEEEELFCMVCSDVVGIQYYKGMVSNNEMVSLIREPHNKYDRNAVKVENSGCEQVGHIKREHARVFSHLLDNGMARLEGVIPFGANNKFRMPVEVFLWGSPDKKETTVTYMKAQGMRPDDSSAKAKRAKGAMSSAAAGFGAMDYGHVVSSKTIVSQQEMQNEMDKLFETLEEGDKTTEREPCQAIATKMYPHQKQALNWMMCKENNNLLPPFWEQRGAYYVNTLTRFQTTGRPRCVMGGILADDMGLGKTLETIALIMTNFVDSKPLAHPIENHHRISFGSSKKVSSKGGSSKSILERKPKAKSDLVSPMKLLTPKFALTKSATVPAVTKTVNNKKTTNSQDCLDAMTKKEDNDYQPEFSLKKASSEQQASLSRPRRAAKRPARYFEEEEEVDEEQPSKSQKVDCATEKTVFAREEPVIVLDDEPMTAPETVVTSIGEETVVQTTSSSPSSEKENVTLTQEVKFPVKTKVDDDLPDLPDVVVVKKEAAPSSSKMGPLPSGCDSSGRTWTSGARGTLIVCPVSVISNWQDQFDEHVDKGVNLNLMVYYGPDRVKKPAKLKEQDVVITTYSTITSDFKTVKTSPLHKIEWLRVVLDEGHIIRNPKAQQSQAIFELKAERRWVLTGTPIQNRLKDLWSLINFLRVQPFTEKAWWSRTIARPVSRGEKKSITLVSHLMGSLALRRLKTHKFKGKPIIELPDRIVCLEKITLSGEERAAYDAMQKTGQIIIGRYFRQGTLLHHYGEVLAILMRLRQMCCHPRLVAKAVQKALETNPEATFTENPPEHPGAAIPGAMDDAERQRLIEILLSVLESGSDEECSICLDSLRQGVITPCAHVYCRHCITSVIENEMPHPKCPLCRAEVHQSRLVEVPPEGEKKDQENVVKGQDGEVWQSSAKIDALMKSLTELRAADPEVKSLVVSQFTSLLSLLEIPLTAAGFSFRRLDGSMNAQERVRNVQEFSAPGSGTPTIFLLSLKAGGVGINLTAASRVFLMDPAWNPAAEDQCFDRCHRLGQTKDVTITRFVIEDSVEERMLDLQDKKRQLMQGAFERISTEERRSNLVNMIRGLINI